MSLLVIIINADFQDYTFFREFSARVPLGEFVFNGDYSDFTRDWYFFVFYSLLFVVRFIKVGISIAILMTLNIFLPHISNLLFWAPLKLFKRKCCWKGKVLQM